MTVKELNKEIDKYLYILITIGNNHPKCFKNQLICSNKSAIEKPSSQSSNICFINYDFKNNLELFKPKQNNPLAFPELLFVEAEKQILFNELIESQESSSKESKSIHLKACVSKEEYIKTVTKLKEHIQSGDVYELNYCITFEAHNVDINPLDIYLKLNQKSKASYSSFAKFNNLYIISSSPELYLSKQGQKLISKPIKGTVKRGLNQAEDERLKTNLHNSLKERTENVMIVDVVRNDFSRIAQNGSVHVDSLFNIESYEQVHQMVSTVSCNVKGNHSFKDIIDASFPMASMTGAPKYRAMQLIEDYELYNRGPYSGSVGYIDAEGNFDLNVLIRSIFYDQQKRYLSFSVGSAITAMCNPEEEYEECLLKAKALVDVLT